MEIKGLTALITGASGGLGSQIALALANAGCNCICHYHNNETYADELVKKIDRSGNKAIAVRADLTDQTQLASLFKTGLGAPQILVNSAAVFSKQPLSEVTFQNAAGLEIVVNITHPRTRHLTLTLLSPSGTTVMLWDEAVGDGVRVVGREDHRTAGGDP